MYTLNVNTKTKQNNVKTCNQYIFLLFWFSFNQQHVIHISYIKKKKSGNQKQTKQSGSCKAFQQDAYCSTA